MKPPVWVIDTHALVSATLTAGGTCDQILRAAIAGRIHLVWNAPMLADYRAVLQRPKFGFSRPIVTSLFAAFDPLPPPHRLPAADPQPALGLHASRPQG